MRSRPAGCRTGASFWGISAHGVVPTWAYGYIEPAGPSLGELIISEVDRRIAAGTAYAIIFDPLIGNVIGAPVLRLITIVYTARVADIAAAQAGATITNSAHAAWDNSARTPPASAGASFDQTSVTASAPVTVIEPHMSIAKTVSDPTVDKRSVMMSPV